MFLISPGIAIFPHTCHKTLLFDLLLQLISKYKWKAHWIVCVSIPAEKSKKSL